MIQISNELMNTLLVKGFIQTDKFTIVSDEVMNSTLNDLQKSLSAKDFDIVKANRSHLVKKVVTDKNGRQKTVWVNPNEKEKKKLSKREMEERKYAAPEDLEDDIYSGREKDEMIKNINEVLRVIGGHNSNDLSKNLKDYISETFLPFRGEPSKKDLADADKFTDEVTDFVNGKSKEFLISYDDGYIEINSKDKTITAKSGERKKTFPMKESSWDKISDWMG